MAFTVSTAQVSISPSLDVNPYMAGYGTLDGGREATSSDPYESLWARAIVLWENGSPNLIMSVDILALPRSIHQRARQRILALADWSNSDILIQSTHTHNGPVVIDTLHPFMCYGLSDLSMVETYSQHLEDDLVEAAQTALNASQTSVTLDYKVTTASIAYNRAGLSYLENTVPVIVMRKGNGVPRAVIFNYACHPVAAGMRTLFDGDFPAGACNYIENNNPGCFALFLQGAAGDQNPMGVPSWELRDEYATTLGSAVSTAMQSAGRTIGSPLQTSYKEIQIPLDITPTAGNMAAVRAAYASRLPNLDGNPAWYGRHAQVMIGRIDSGSYATSVACPFQVWKFGGSPQLRIGIVGGELVSGYAAYFRGRYGGANGVIVGGYGNESCYYLPSAQFLPPYSAGGSYEGGWDPDYPGIAGGAMTVYGHIAHFKGGTTGVEATIINTLDGMLA
ncbi:hypothetical protein AB4Y88_10665 [Paenarthrobacter sp. RAF9]